MRLWMVSSQVKFTFITISVLCMEVCQKKCFHVQRSNLRIIETHFRKSRLLVTLGRPNLQKLRRWYCLFLELRERRERENLNLGQRGQNCILQGKDLKKPFRKMLNVFLKQESHTHWFVLALICRKRYGRKHFSIFYVTCSLKMVNKETWKVIVLTWRVPILIVHCFWSYTIPSASSVNPFPWVSCLIMALLHQCFTVPITWDNNLIAV